MDRLFRRFVAFAAILCALAVVSLGQTSGTGAIAGTITDSSGALVGGASVKAVEVATGETRKVTSADNGTYMLPLLKPGTYRLEVFKTGFKMTVSAGIPVHVTETAMLNVKLEVGSVQETVEVTGAGEQLQTETERVGPCGR